MVRQGDGINTRSGVVEEDRVTVLQWELPEIRRRAGGGAKNLLGLNGQKKSEGGRNKQSLRQTNKRKT